LEGLEVTMWWLRLLPSVWIEANVWHQKSVHFSKGGPESQRTDENVIVFSFCSTA